MKVGRIVLAGIFILVIGNNKTINNWCSDDLHPCAAQLQGIVFFFFDLS